MMVLSFLAILLALSSEQPKNVIVSVPQEHMADVKAILRQISYGEYQAPYISVFEDAYKGSVDLPLPIAGESLALVPDGAPCVEPPLPDPRSKPGDTAAYWRYRFADRAIRHLREDELKYQELMRSYRSLCHTRWQLYDLLQGQNPPILQDEAQAEMLVRWKKACAAKDLTLCPAAGEPPQVVFATVSSIAFCKTNSLALVQVYIHLGPVRDQAMWMVFVKTNGTWHHDPAWGGMLVVHD